MGFLTTFPVLTGTGMFLRPASIIAIFLIGAPLLWLIVDYVRILSLRRKMPPGPIPLPVVGNFFDIAKVKPWIQWEKMSQQYNNPMITLWNGRRPMIVCNDIWTASELMEKRANIYSSRPHFVVMGDMMNMSTTNQTCQVYGDQWRVHRRLTHSVVGSQVVRSYRDFQSDEARVLIRDLIHSPDDFVLQIERYSTSVTSIIGWGRRIATIKDPVGQVALSFMEGVDYVIPGLFIMEAIPFLAKLPGWIYPLPSKMLAASKHLQRYFAALAREGALAPEDNFSKRLMAAQAIQGITDEDISSLTANMIGGAVDTTTSTVCSFILAMCCFPDVQRRAQQELDEVVGQDRAPDWSDEGKLPYIKAIISETLRWRTVTILAGIPHAPVQDDVFDGYLIPKDTNITANMWAIHRHPRDFPSPDTFRPERFLGGLERPYPNKKGHNAFGFGRRQCSGQPLAEQGLFTVISQLLWAFNMKPGQDQMGRDIPLDIFAYTKNENMRPEPFKARFIPRSKNIQNMIEQDAEKALVRLSVYDGESKVTLASVM